MNNKTELANFALMSLGQGQIQSIDDAGLSATLCASWVDTAVEVVLSKAEWLCVIKRQALAKGGAPIESWVYRYALPDDCLNVIAILPSNGLTPETFIDWEVEGGFINTDEPNAILKYTYKPKNIDDIDNHIAMAIGYKLAMLIGPGLGMEKETGAMREVERDYEAALGQAMTRNRNSKKPKTATALWGK
jgi:hypothetical protein